jgi:hypothetical protein
MNEAAAIATESLQSLDYLAAHKPSQAVEPGIEPQTALNPRRPAFSI